MNKRKSPRFNVEIALRYRMLESLSAPLAIKTEDMSEGGIRVVLSEPLEHETRLELTIHVPNQSKAIFAIGRVVWVKPQTANRGFITGIQFTYIKEKDKQRFYQYALL